MRVRLAIVGASPCDRCVAACCKQNGHDYAVLLQGDQEHRRFAAWSQAVNMTAEGGRGPARAEQVLPYVDGRCPFLGEEDDRCTIYDARPRACRQFECVQHFAVDGPGLHGRFLQLNPHVLKLLETL